VEEMMVAIEVKEIKGGGKWAKNKRNKIFGLKLRYLLIF
jgi:hypothetical protein